LPVEHARATARRAVLGLGDDVPVVDEALQVLAHRVRVELRRRDELGDGPLRLILHEVQDLDA
jgi:hypothetical protein